MKNNDWLRSCVGVFGIGLAAVAPQASAQNWPDRPVHILIGYSPGGTVDAWCRMLARRLEERFKQPFVVENRPGANATLATAAIAQGPTDGYLFSLLPLTTHNRSFLKNVSWDPMNDFEPLAGIYKASLAFAASATTPFRSVKDVVDYAKANPGKLNFGTGVTTFMLFATVIKQHYGFDAVLVPYKGQGPALAALISGEIHVSFDQLASLKPQSDAGKLRVLAVTAEQRTSVYPDAPTFAELGAPGLTYTGSSILWARRGFLPEAADKLNAAIPDILKLPEVQERLRLEAAEAYTATRAQLWQQYQKDTKFMVDAAKAANFEPQ